IDTTFGVPLVGTRIGLIITYLTFSLPFSIWMLAGYFDGIPRELDQAGKVDGAGNLTILLRIILPAARPGIVAVAIYAFMTAWGEVLFASVLTTEETRTLAVGLRQYATQTNVYWNQILAASIAVSLPVGVGLLTLQENFRPRELTPVPLPERTPMEISVQLYSVREALADDVQATLSRLVDLGLAHAEPYHLLEYRDELVRAREQLPIAFPSAHQSFLGEVD